MKPTSSRVFPLSTGSRCQLSMHLPKPALLSGEESWFQACELQFLAEDEGFILSILGNSPFTLSANKATGTAPLVAVIGKIIEKASLSLTCERN